jgi:hypothetical protein
MKRRVHGSTARRRIDVGVTHEYTATAFPETQYGSFTDESARLWIWTAGCNVGDNAITRPRLTSRVLALGAGDEEYLLLGRVAPQELEQIRRIG